MLEPRYQDPRPSAAPATFKALKAFVLAYGQPALAPDLVVQGWQNRVAMPTGGEYAVITLVDSARRGTDRHELLHTTDDEGEPEIYRGRAYYETRAQVDFVSRGEEGRQRALSLVTAACSTFGYNFFKPFGLALEGAEGPRDLTGPDDGLQFARRFMVSLMLGHWAGVDVGTAWVGAGSGPAFNINIKGDGK